MIASKGRLCGVMRTFVLTIAADGQAHDLESSLDAQERNVA